MKLNHSESYLGESKAFRDSKISSQNFYLLDELFDELSLSKTHRWVLIDGRRIRTNKILICGQRWNIDRGRPDIWTKSARSQTH